MDRVGLLSPEYLSLGHCKRFTKELVKKKFGGSTAILLSPLDRIRSGINERAISLGLKRCLDKSFELNQSFPRISRRCVREYEIDIEKTGFSSKNTMEKLRVDGANGLRFSIRRGKGCFTPGTGSPYNNSFVNTTNDSALRIPKSGINPNKAVFTIDSKSSQILIVNHNACQLLGYSSKELCNLQFSSLLSNKKKGHVSALAEGQLNSEDGTMVLLSGKVVEMTTKVGSKVAVSLWIRQIDNEGRCLAVAEPVERRVTEIIIDQNGTILHADYEAVILFQLDSEDKLIGLDISTLIPAINLPFPDNSITKNIRKQKATGKTQDDGVSFPLCLMINDFDAENDRSDIEILNCIADNHCYVVTIWVFTNLSGLIVINENGIIESCNHHFSMLMFGYSEVKILGQFITKIIPNFGQEFQYLGYRSRNATISSLDDAESETETDPVCVISNLTKSEIWTPMKTPADIISATTNLYDNKTPVKCNVDVLTMTTNTTTTTSPMLISKFETEAAVNSSKISLNISSSSQVNGSFGIKSKNIHNLHNLVENITEESDEKENNLDLVNCMNDLSMAEHQLDVDLLTPVNEMMDVGNLGCSSMETQSVIDSSAYTPTGNDSKMENSLLTSTPFIASGVQQQQQKKMFMDGNYKGEAIHNDGNIIDIIYTISCQTLPCGRRVFCVWISRDPDSEDFDDFDDEDERHQNLTLTFNSGNSQMDNSLGQAGKTTIAQNSSRPNSLSLVSQCEEEQISGEFGQHYTTLKQIGKGAYGYVKMAYRNSDRLLVIAKFILKEKLCSQFMILTDDNKEVPMEIYLLSTVKHPNIVTVYDVFENDKFFQLVMEKHGSGMDLFEFIDRRPLMDEKLACFIFRQIANAVDYLHSLNILHRDIKDENIIIDHNFHVKLIDFGSATFMQEGKLFSTFFGTTEYCSPEVLAGNKYAGPELEMWSLGVTLYVLIFFENPFLDIEETLRGDLRIPHNITAELENLLLSMLDKNPKTRCTMKQLMEDKWLNQEIMPNYFNFINIVRCEAYESNPDKYYIGQKFSSATGLSTTSPQDSLSLVDDDSIIDGDEEDEDKSIPSQDQDNGFKLESLPSVGYSESIGSVSSSSHFMNIDLNNETLNQTGNLIDINISVPEPIQDKFKVLKNEKLFLMDDMDFVSDSKKNVNKLIFKSFMDDKYCDDGGCSNNTELFNINDSNGGGIKNLQKSIYFKNSDNNFTSTTYIDLKDLDFNFDEEQYKNYDKNSILINSYSDTNLNDTQKNDNITKKITTSKSTNFNENLNKIPSTSLVLESPKKSLSKDLKFIQTTNGTLSNITTTIAPSKSETNIFENSNKIKPTSKYTIYDVVSLNNLTSEDIFSNTSNMVDLSKTQILNKISDEDFVFDN